MGIYDREYYGDSRTRPLAWLEGYSMVNLLIIANVAVFVANFLFTSSSDALTELLMLRPSTLLEPWNWWRLLSYGFAHANLQHILFNMLSLFFLGRAVENRIGKWEFLRFYLLTLVLCGVVWCVLHWQQDIYALGASGAVTGVSMLFVFFFPNSTIYLWMAVPVKAWVLGVLIIVLNVMTPSTSDGSVAYDIHLVGAGVAAAYFFGKLNLQFLGAWFGRLSSQLRARKRGLRVHRSADSTRSTSSRGESKLKTADEEEADRILRKIYEQGESSLTPKERKFMESYSRKMRGRRN